MRWVMSRTCPLNSRAPGRLDGRDGELDGELRSVRPLSGDFDSLPEDGAIARPTEVVQAGAV